jgi:hypothetical protein
VIVAGLVLIGVAAAVLLRAYVTGQLHRRTRRAPRTTDRSADGARDRHPSTGDVDAASLRPWIARGIQPEVARPWIDQGFDADHAFLLISMGVGPGTAARLRTAGIEDSAVVRVLEEALFQHHVRQEDLVTVAERAGDLAPQAVGWMARGLSADRALAYARAGITPQAADAWSAAGWNVGEALPWFEARFEPAAAQAWRDSGFDAASAHAWKAEHFGVRQAMAWRRLGDTPEAARAVEQQFVDAGVTVTDGLRWLDRGFSVDEICAGWPSLQATSATDADAWREQWHDLPLSPREAAAWNEEFSPEETARWLDAGVRDVTAAVRLRHRGLDVDSVHTIADRLAQAFDAVPVWRDDLLSAAGHLARSGGDPTIRQHVQAAAGSSGDAKEVSADLIEALLAELKRLDAAGLLGAPHAARALGRRLEEGLIVSELITGRGGRIEAGHTLG